MFFRRKFSDRLPTNQVKLNIISLDDRWHNKISPSSIHTDRKDKLKLYAAAKVKDYWIVDPKAKTIEAYHLVSAKYIGRVRGSGSDVVSLSPFKKLRIRLAKLWRPRA